MERMTSRHSSDANRARRKRRLPATGAAPRKAPVRDPAVRTDPLRSRIMRSVRRQGTKPEQAVAHALRTLGLRFRRNVRGLPGSPDFVNGPRRCVVMVHGCFWHAHLGCRYATLPRRNREFWEGKLWQNRKRDREKLRQLRRLGFLVCTVWECETRQPERLRSRLRRWLLAHDLLP